MLDDGDELEAYTGNPVHFSPAEWRDVHALTNAEIKRLEAELNLAPKD